MQVMDQADLQRQEQLQHLKLQKSQTAQVRPPLPGLCHCACYSFLHEPLPILEPWV